MKAVETFGIKWESTGADKIKKDLKDSRNESDKAEKSLNTYSDTSLELKKNIRDLSIEQKKATDEEKKRVSTEKIHAKTSQDNVVSMTKKQKDADKTAGLFTDKNKKLADSLMKIGKVTAAVAIPLALLKKGFDSVSAFGEKGNALSIMAAQSMSSTADVQDLGLASEIFGGNAASASAMMGQLKLNLQEMKVSEGGGPLWAAASKYPLKIDSNATGQETLVNISKAMQGLTEEAQMHLGSMVGLDLPTIMLIKDGPNKLAERMAEARKSRVMGDADVDTAVALETSSITLSKTIDKKVTEIDSSLAPSVTFLNNSLSKALDPALSGSYIAPKTKKERTWDFIRDSLMFGNGAFIKKGMALEATDRQINSVGGTSSTTNNVNITVRTNDEGKSMEAAVVKVLGDVVIQNNTSEK